MANYRIVLTPSSDEELLYQLDITCRDGAEAKNQASAYLAMSGSKFKSAVVLSQWKSPISWRQAFDPITNNFNL